MGLGEEVSQVVLGGHVADGDTTKVLLLLGVVELDSYVLGALVGGLVVD